MDKKGKITVRFAEASDARFAAELEQICFSHPWKKEDFEKMVSEAEKTLLVAECDGELCGYIGAYTVCGESDVTTVAVSEAFRGRGIGKMLVLRLCETLSGDIFLEVRESNAAARRVYESCGFSPCGKRRGYYQTPTEDAVLYRFAGSEK